MHEKLELWLALISLAFLVTGNLQLLKIMSAISDFAAKQAEFQKRIDAAVADLQGDIQSLNDKITALQNTQGQITPEDQALLDQIQATSSQVADKLDALDAITPVVSDGSGIPGDTGKKGPTTQL